MKKKTIATLATLAGLCLAAPASALSAPVLGVAVSHTPADPSGFVSGKTVVYDLALEDLSATDAIEAPAELKFSVPADSGLEVTEVKDQLSEELFGGAVPIWNCTHDSTSVTCTGPELEGELEPIPTFPEEEACVGVFELYFGAPLTCHVQVTVASDPELKKGVVTPTAQACGGGAAACGNATDPTKVYEGFDFAAFDGTTLDELGDPYNTAGGHPFAVTTEFQFPRTFDSNGGQVTSGSLQDLVTVLPAGFVGDPSAVPTCAEVQLALDRCPPQTQLGTLDITGSDGSQGEASYPIYNMVVAPGRAGEFGVSFGGAVFAHLFAANRPDGRLVITVSKITQLVSLAGTRPTFWGFLPTPPTTLSEPAIPR